MDLEYYKKQKNLVIDNFKKLDDIASSLDMKKLSGQLHKNIDQINQEKFQLVVVGEFSRGKSTFVNAMLGRRVLPSSKRPTTAVISKIVYSDEPRFILHYKNGKKDPREISEEEFFSLTAPRAADLKDKLMAVFRKKQQEELDSISYAEVGYPLIFCKDNVDVVDTPGTNDLNTGRIEITYKYVEQADAVILVLAANQPLTASELEFLRKRILGNQIKDIFFVINYKDAVGGPDKEKMVYQHVIDNLHERIPELPNDLKVYMVSSLQALLYRRQEHGEVLKPKQMMQLPTSFEESGFVDFEAGLGRFLGEEKGRSKLQKYARRGTDAAGKIYDDIETRLDLATHSVDEIEEKAARLEPEFRRMKSEAKKLTRMMRINFQSAETELSSRCDIAINDIKRSACQAVDDFSGEYTRSNIQHAINKAVTNSQEDFIDDISQVQKDIFEREISNANLRIQRLWKDLYIDYCGKNNLDIKMENNISFDFDLDLSTGDEASTAIGAGVGAAIGGIIAGPVGALVGGFLGAIFGNNDNDDDEPDYDEVDKKIKKSLNKNFDDGSKMKEQIIRQYKRHSDDACRQVEKSVHDRLDDMEAQLKSVLQQKKLKKQDAKQIMNDLHTKQRQVKEIYHSLAEV